MELVCPACKTVLGARPGAPMRCPSCGKNVTTLDQLAQVLDWWWEPRRWRADLTRPTVYLLLEQLWTANGQGERLYQGISPRNTNYDIFRHLITRLIARGVEEGWMDLRFPPDPLVEDPVYHLEFKNPDRFAREVERLFPDVDWDEQIEPPKVTA